MNVVEPPFFDNVHETLAFGNVFGLCADTFRIFGRTYPTGLQWSAVGFPSFLSNRHFCCTPVLCETCRHFQDLFADNLRRRHTLPFRRFPIFFFRLPLVIALCVAPSLRYKRFEFFFWVESCWVCTAIFLANSTKTWPENPCFRSDSHCLLASYSSDESCTLGLSLETGQKLRHHFGGGEGRLE